MKCCKKGLVVLAVLAVVGFVLARSGWGEIALHKAMKGADKKIPAELQLEKTRQEISELDRDLDNNWTPIAVKEGEIKKLKKDMDGLRDYIAKSEVEVQTALADLKAGAKRVSLKTGSSKVTEAEARQALLTKANLLAARKHELELREKQLGDEERTLEAAMATQQAIITQKAELEAEVAALSAELTVMRLEQKQSKMVLRDGSRLDGIRKKLENVREDINTQKRVLELKKQYQPNTSSESTKTEKTKELTNDEVISQVESVLNKGKAAGNGD